MEHERRIVENELVRFSEYNANRIKIRDEVAVYLWTDLVFEDLKKSWNSDFGWSLNMLIHGVLRIANAGTML